jgi:hypothetical protein
VTPLTRAETVKRLENVRGNGSRSIIALKPAWESAIHYLTATCATCRHWDRRSVPSASGLRFCLAPYDRYPDIRLFHNGVSRMMTADQFSCNLHQPLPAPPEKGPTT